MTMTTPPAEITAVAGLDSPLTAAVAHCLPGLRAPGRWVTNTLEAGFLARHRGRPRGRRPVAYIPQQFGQWRAMLTGGMFAAGGLIAVALDGPDPDYPRSVLGGGSYRYHDALSACADRAVAPFARLRGSYPPPHACDAAIRAITTLADTAYRYYYPRGATVGPRPSPTVRGGASD